MPVYIVGIGVQVSDTEVLMKVGFTENSIRGRISQLQTGSPFEIVPLVAFDEGEWLEDWIHFYWKPKRVSGEWFRVSAAEISALVRILEERGISTAGVDPDDEDTSLGLGDLFHGGGPNEVDTKVVGKLMHHEGGWFFR